MDDGLLSVFSYQAALVIVSVKNFSIPLYKEEVRGHLRFLGLAAGLTVFSMSIFNSSRLAGKTVLITGASSGIGKVSTCFGIVLALR